MSAPRPQLRGKRLSGKNGVTSISRFALAAELLSAYRTARPGRIDDCELEAWLQEHWGGRLAASSAKSTRRILGKLRLTRCSEGELQSMFSLGPGSSEARRAHVQLRFGEGVRVPNELIAAFLLGALTGYADETPVQALQRMGFAGTRQSAGNIVTTGRSVGRFFGLLDEHDQPTAFYDEFFRP